MRVEKYGLEWQIGARGDEYILNENSYRCIFDPSNKTSLQKDDVWMDIGAHFGSFAVRAATKVHRVIAVEPFPPSVDKLETNIDINGITNVDVIRGAVIGGPDQWVELALGHTFDYTHRVGHVRGRESMKVMGYRFDDLVSAYLVNKVKIDAEGMEDEILGNTWLNGIDELIMEWHFTLIPDPDWSKLRFRLQQLERAGFKILKAPPDLAKPTKRWTAIIWARR